MDASESEVSAVADAVVAEAAANSAVVAAQTAVALAEGQAAATEMQAAEIIADVERDQNEWRERVEGRLSAQELMLTGVQTQLAEAVTAMGALTVTLSAMSPPQPEAEVTEVQTDGAATVQIVEGSAPGGGEVAPPEAAPARRKRRWT